MRDDRMQVDGRFWELGVVESAEINAYPCLTFWLHFKFHGCGQGFGGYALDEWDKQQNRRVGCAPGADLLSLVMATAGVEKWSDMQGQLLWAIRDQDSYSATISGIARPAPLLHGEHPRVLLISEWRKHWFPESTGKRREP